MPVCKDGSKVHSCAIDDGDEYNGRFCDCYSGVVEWMPGQEAAPEGITVFVYPFHGSTGFVYFPTQFATQHAPITGDGINLCLVVAEKLLFIHRVPPTGANGNRFLSPPVFIIGAEEKKYQSFSPAYSLIRSMRPPLLEITSTNQPLSVFFSTRGNCFPEGQRIRY